MILIVVFFFQAEDGIRDVAVTGVQTCALPIFPVDWRDRFIRAYDTELQEWLDAVAAGTATGPTAWDGFAAAVVTDAALEALRTGQRTAVPMPERPEFY